MFVELMPMLKQRTLLNHWSRVSRCVEKRVASTFFGVPVHFISLHDLVANKKALGRSSDLKDLKQNPKRINSDK